MNDAIRQDENLRRCPTCGKDMLMLHAKARTWLCRNCGYQEPLPEGRGAGDGEEQETAQE